MIEKEEQRWFDLKLINIKMVNVYRSQYMMKIIRKYWLKSHLRLTMVIQLGKKGEGLCTLLGPNREKMLRQIKIEFD